MIPGLCNRYCIRLLCLIGSFVVFLHLNTSAGDFIVTKAKFITKFPFLLASRGIVIIKGQLGNFPDTLNFILDTGSGGISLDYGTAKHLHLTATESTDTIVGIAHRKTAEFIHDQQLQLPGLTVENLNFHLNDYSFLTAAYNIKIDGVVGYSFLKSYIVKLNYDALSMEVWLPGSIKYPSGGFLMPAGVNKLTAIDATLSDNRKIDSRFYFDTGADMCFLLSDKFIKDSSVLSNNKKIIASQGEGLGGKKDMMLTTIDKINIGPYTIKKVPAYIFNDANNVANYPATGGIMGNELLQRFNAVINYPGNEIHLLPNARFDDPFNYTYVGFSILNANGKLVIKDIITDSPAHAAGLENDDIIFGINNNFENNIDAYNMLLTKTGAKLKVFVLRGNQVKSTVVEVKSIL